MSDEVQAAESDSKEVDRVNHADAAVLIGISESDLREWKSQDWFPESGFKAGAGGGYDVEAILAADHPPIPGPDSEILNDPDSDGEPAYVINKERVSTPCPSKIEWHVTKVVDVRGRIRHCVCDTCGESFTVPGQYPDIQRETMHRVVRVLENAEVFELKGEDDKPAQVLLFKKSVIDEIKMFLRGAIKAK